MYEYDKNSSSSLTSAPQPHLPSSSSPSPDEISLFLHQIFLRSSSLMPHMPQLYNSKTLPANLDRSALAQDGGISSSHASGRVFLSNVSTDEYDCESEEGLEALVEGAQAKLVPSRSSSKRSRAAEVHNFSEKRRRSRINEKMKALQNLIPNSNKTDKASMLDEAIEYLKQIQLQVQMLSMRNGLSLHPIGLPGALQPIQFSQMRMDFGEEYRPMHLNMTGTRPLTQETPLHGVFTLPNQRTALNQPSVSNMSNIINSETSFGLESSIQAHLGPFQLHTSSEGICREDMLRQHQSNGNHPDTNSLEVKMGSTASVALPFNNTQASNLKDSNSLETCIIGRDHSESVLLKNIEHNLTDATFEHANRKKCPQ